MTAKRQMTHLPFIFMAGSLQAADIGRSIGLSYSLQRRGSTGLQGFIPNPGHVDWL